MRTKSKRLAVVLLCYAISSYGIFGSLAFTSLVFLIAGIGKQNLLFCLPFIIVFTAWLCHILMCLKWISGKYIDRFLIRTGIFSGTTSLLMFSIPFIVESFIREPLLVTVPLPLEDEIMKNLTIVGIELLIISPCLFLILFIIKQNNLIKTGQ